MIESRYNSLKDQYLQEAAGDLAIEIVGGRLQVRVAGVLMRLVDDLEDGVAYATAFLEGFSKSRHDAELARWRALRTDLTELGYGEPEVVTDTVDGKRTVAVKSSFGGKQVTLSKGFDRQTIIEEAWVLTRATIVRRAHAAASSSDTVPLPAEPGEIALPTDAVAVAYAKGVAEINGHGGPNDHAVLALSVLNLLERVGRLENASGSRALEESAGDTGGTLFSDYLSRKTA